MGNYYRVPMDARDLNYEKGFTEWTKTNGIDGEFNSDNAPRLNVEQIKEKLLTTDYVKEQLNNWRK